MKSRKTEDADARGGILLTVREVAELDRVSEKTVRRAIGSGVLEAIRVGPGGRLVRITRKAHSAYRRRFED